jgi:hypothetical protein
VLGFFKEHIEIAHCAECAPGAAQHFYKGSVRDSIEVIRENPESGAHPPRRHAHIAYVFDVASFTYAFFVIEHPRLMQ